MAPFNGSTPEFLSTARKESSTVPPMRLVAQELASRIAGPRPRNKAGAGMTLQANTAYDPQRHTPKQVNWRRQGPTDSTGKPALMARDMKKEVIYTTYMAFDMSRSMRFQSEDSACNKAQEAGILGMALAYLTVAAGDQFTVLGSDMNMGRRENAVDNMAATLNRMYDREADLPSLSQYKGRPLERGSFAVIFTDAMTDPEALQKKLKQLARTGVKGHVVQVLDPVERDMTFDGNVNFVDLKTGDTHDKIGDVAAIRENYVERFNTHQQELHAAVKGVPGWRITTHYTGETDRAATLKQVLGITPPSRSLEPIAPAGRTAATGARPAA